MQKYTKAVAIAFLLYVLPLLAVPALIVHYKILILIVAVLALLLSQPEVSARDAADQKLSDRGTVFLILTAGMLSQILPVVEWAYFGSGVSRDGDVAVTLIGFTTMAVGLAFRIWSIRSLGRFFTSTVQIADGHRVIRTGPYAVVRHPSYLGAFTAIVGAGIFLNAPFGTLTAAVLMIVAYTRRIATEEVALVAALGDEYRDYQRRTRRIIPLIW